MGRTGTSRCCWLLRLALGVLFLLTLQGVQSEHEPTESECRPYIEKALKEQHVDADDELLDDTDASLLDQEENPPIDEPAESIEEPQSGEDDGSSATAETADNNDDNDHGEQENKTDEQNDDDDDDDDDNDNDDDQSGVETESIEGQVSNEDTAEESHEDGNSREADAESHELEASSSSHQQPDTAEDDQAASQESDATEEPQAASQESDPTEDDQPASQESDTASVESATAEEGQAVSQESDTTEDDQTVSQENEATEEEGEGEGKGEEEAAAASQEADTVESQDDEDASDTAETPDSQPTDTEDESDSVPVQADSDSGSEEGEGDAEAGDGETASQETAESAASEENQTVEASQDSNEPVDEEQPSEESEPEPESEDAATTETQSDETEEQQENAVEDLILETLIPDNLRSRDHIIQILKLDQESVETETALTKTIETTLKTLKNLYDTAIKPLEILYKYRDLSNRHFGDPEIFSKPLVLFMGPWSGGKSSTINYLLDLEFKELALRTGAEPSPAYFNILTHGEETEILDGTQLAADWTFSGLQKFGQGMLDRLRGVKLNNRLLEKVNIVEIPGILEIRKQVQRLFPFNDACQWFIDRADIIFLIYDPAKLDVGPETEAILDQLKGREYQTRIILNKADTVKPEELMRVQGTLIWNISPLMSSQEPPVMYTTSLWSLPYESSAPTRLLIAQERAFLRDLRDAIDRRIENKIASARRFAVRVRNHAKMVDCYLTTYYNHKTFFGNRKKISDDITENPTKYHIYEGLSTLTNISRYDLPDPDMYRDFFRINPLYEFTKLSDTCTYFRGCPINKLDIAIAYDLPELVGKYKKAVEAAKTTRPKS